MGADGVEFDVQLSADGVPVVIHDASVDRTTDGTGRVADLTLDQLKQLDAGSHFSPAFAGERIPSLAEVLEMLAAGLLLDLELKSTAIRDRGLEQAVLDQVAAHGVEHRVLISSFNPLSLRRVKRLAPVLPVGLLYGPRAPLGQCSVWLARSLPLEAHHPHHTMVTRDSVLRARRRGHRVNTWTVDEPAEMERLIALGADAIITNVPDTLGSVLGLAASEASARSRPTMASRALDEGPARAAADAAGSNEA